ncbi:MAG: hypothetical protein QM479_13000 [Pseudomonadota bacterium]
MPIMDGYQACRQIRILESLKQLDKNQKIPIIALTANVMDDGWCCKKS